LFEDEGVSSRIHQKRISVFINVFKIKEGNMKDIKTTLAGLAAGIVYIVAHIHQIQLPDVLQALALFLMGLYSSDSSSKQGN